MTIELWIALVFGVIAVSSVAGSISAVMRESWRQASVWLCSAMLSSLAVTILVGAAVIVGDR